MNGWSAADERSALSALMPAITRLSEIDVPSVCVASVLSAASRAPDLVYDTSVSSTDLSLHRSALYHLRTAGGRQPDSSAWFESKVCQVKMPWLSAADALA